MILSRVIEHVKKQHWTAVALDFVIVVMGVYIGIQLGNWNEARAEKRLGRDYVARLTADLGQDFAASKVQIDYYGEVLNAVRRTETLLKDDDADPKALVAAAYRATELMILTPNDATWDQIVASGHLALLPDGAAPALAAYFKFDAASDAYSLLSRSEYRHVVRRMIPIEVQDAIRAGCSDALSEVNATIGFVKDCKIDVDPALLRSTADALRRDPEVASALNYQYSDLRLAIGNLSSRPLIINRALAALGAEPIESEAP